MCETITGDESDPVSKTSHQGPQDNQQERGFSNHFGHPRDKLYRDLLQYRLPRNQEMPGQGKFNYSQNSIVQASDMKETLE